MYKRQRLTRVSAFALRNELNLWSNFTYRLDDPENGDQFEQADRRYVLGIDASHQWSSRWGGRTADARIGAGVRYDDIGSVGLYATRERARLSTTRADTVGEASLFAFAESTYAWTSHVRSTLGLRGDYYVFDVASDVPVNSGSPVLGSTRIVVPRASLLWKPNPAFA